MTDTTANMPARLGIDVGGTFVDLVLKLDSGELYTEKCLVDPADLIGAIEEGLRGLLDGSGVHPASVAAVIHATTRGSNAVLERRGPNVALLTTQGFRDVLHIARGQRWSLYDVQLRQIEPLVPRAHTWEISERCMADGSVLRALDEDEVRAVARELKSEGLTDVAVAFMHSYVRPDHERRTRELLIEEVPDMHVTVSSDISLQGREYERANTAVVNALLVPVLRQYLEDLERMLPRSGIVAPLWIMQSNGGLASVAQAATLPVRTIESGPAAGVHMAARYGALAGHRDVIAFDMGGTTAKAAIVRGGVPSTTRSFELERAELRPGSGLPLDIPAIDLVEVGAGGGSIADGGLGVLRVGPRSAGARPGPVCYGRGGTQPTVTDANLALGYLNPDFFAGGTLTLDADATRDAIDRLAEELDLDRTRAAWGIHEMATLEMERAVRLISIGVGLDPRQFALVCTGGSAPAHGCRLAQSLGIPQVVVPPAAGVGSALGLLEARESIELARTHILTLQDPGAASRVDAIYKSLEDEGRSIIGDSWEADGLTVRRACGLRYAGQGFELEAPFEGDASGLDVLQRAFFERYEQTYGYLEEGRPVEAVTWYLSIFRAADDRPRSASNGTGLPNTRASSSARTAKPRATERRAYFPDSGFVDVPVLDRDALRTGTPIDGPCLVEESHTTTVVPPGAVLEVDTRGALVITIGEVNHGT